MVFKLQKYFYAFIICVAIPCLILGFLAYRGIRNDQALIERKIRQFHEQTAAHIEKELVSYSELVENAVLPTIGHPDSIVAIGNPFVHPDSTVRCIFYFRDSGQAYFYPPLLYQKATTGSGIPTTLSENPILQQAQKAEFQEQRFDQAIQFYRNLQKTSRDSSDLMTILLALARNYQKSRRYESALACLQEVKIISERRETQAETPIGLMAAMAECDLLEIMQREQTRCQKLFDIYEKMLNSKWRLSESVFNFYVEKVKTAHVSIIRDSLQPSYQNLNSKLDRLSHSEAIRRRYTEHILEFQTAFYQSRTKLEHSINEPSPWTKQEILFGHNHYAASIRKTDGNSDRGYLGILWNPPKLCQWVYHHLTVNSIPPEIHGLQITDFEGSPFYQTGDYPPEMILLDQSISSDYFPWEIITFYQPAPFFHRMFTPQQSLYLMIFILIAGVLCFSFIFFSRTIRHELEFLELRSRFISTVSHEFKSPLTAIIQLAELLDTKRVKTSARRQIYYRIILEQCRKLSDLIENLLNFAQIKQKRWTYHFEEIRLIPFLEDIITRFRERLNDTELQIEFQKMNFEISFTGDHQAMEIVINNIIDNAIKYSKSVKKIEVILTLQQDLIQIKIRDYGIGISTTEIDKIFHEFYRGNSPIQKTIRGTGLGLTIVQQIVTDHHGRISVESTPDQGSTFTIELPLAKVKGKKL